MTDPLSPLSRYQIAVDQAHAYLHREHHPLAEEVVRFMLEGMLVLEPAQLDLLVIWLTGNESRIAQSVDDLGMLSSVFERIIGRRPNAQA